MQLCVCALQVYTCSTSYTKQSAARMATWQSCIYDEERTKECMGRPLTVAAEGATLFLPLEMSALCVIVRQKKANGVCVCMECVLRCWFTLRRFLQ